MSIVERILSGEGCRRLEAPRTGGRSSRDTRRTAEGQRHVAELINSRNDTLTDAEVIEELNGLLALGRPWAQVFAQAD